eukprot:tig00000178_g12825.t1
MEFGSIVGDATQVGGQCQLNLAPPSTSLVFGTKVLPSSTVDQTERFLVSPSFELGAPLTIAFWLRISRSQANPNALLRLVDFGSGVGLDNIILSFCGPPGAVPSDADCEPHRNAGYETLLLSMYDGTQLKQRVPLFLAEHSIPRTAPGTTSRWF